MKSAFTYEQNCASLAITSSIWCSWKTEITMHDVASGENRPSCCTSDGQVIFMYPVIYGLIRYPLTSCMLELDLKPTGCVLPLVALYFDDIDQLFVMSCGISCFSRLVNSPLSWCSLHSLATTWLPDTSKLSAIGYTYFQAKRQLEWPQLLPRTT